MKRTFDPSSVVAYKSPAQLRAEYEAELREAIRPTWWENFQYMLHFGHGWRRMRDMVNESWIQENLRQT